MAAALSPPSLMSTHATIWTDPTYRRFFRRAEETIAAERQLLAQPWLGERDAWLHRVILQICGVSAEEPALA